MTPLSDVLRGIQTCTAKTVTYLVLAADPETYLESVRDLDDLYFSDRAAYRTEKQTLLSNAIRNQSTNAGQTGTISESKTETLTI